VGVVENVIEARAGWPPEITLKLPDGSVKKGRLSDFREPNSAERKKSPPPTNRLRIEGGALRDGNGAETINPAGVRPGE